MSDQGLDILWVLVSAVLVALMQPGFTALEAGATRAKNNISTAQKNITDFVISFLIFITLGASIMLGSSQGGWLGWDSVFFYQEDLSQTTYVIFQAMFASTAVTIVSGAVVERTKFVSYIVIAIFLSLIIYPIEAHWVWNSQGWLAKLGFIDFAGSTVVHSVGGWVALAAAMIIGPRIGRFESQHVKNFEGSNLALSTAGVLFIWLGWIGFNGGSVLALNAQTGLVILNTFIAGTVGGVTGMFISGYTLGYFKVDVNLNSILAGLVAITASAHLASPLDAMWIGALGSLSYFFGQKMLLHWRIDDAIDAIPTHLFAGVAGTLAVALVMPDGVSVVEQLKIQLLGVLVIGFFVMGLSWLFLSLINRVMPLRVSESDEVIGLNVSEHKASSSVLDLILSMNHQAVTRDFSRRIMAEPYSEAEPIAIFYNSVTQAFNQLNAEKEALLEETFRMANYDSLTGLAKRRVMINVLNQVIARLDREALSHAVMFIDLDGFKAVNDNQGHEAGDLLLREVAQRIETCIGKSDLASRFGGDEFVVLLEDIKNENHAAMVADKLIATIKEPVVLQNAKTVQVGASIGICVFGRANLPTTADEILKFADEAMYAAKRRGKGQWLVC